MLSLYTTEHILTEIYHASDNHESTIWYTFIKPENGKICSSLNVRFNDNTDFDTNDYNPVYQLAHSCDIPVNNPNDTIQGRNINSFFSDVIKLNLDTIDDPFAIFLLDIKPDEARRISAKYGVICHSIQEDPATCPIFSEPNEIYVAKDQQGKGWANLLTPECVTPTNSLIIIDRYLFSKEHQVSNAKDGFDNLEQIIKTILPKTLGEKVKYHILVVFDMSKSEKKHKFESISKSINEFMKKIEKPYSIVVEIISIDSNNGFYSETHNRRIISNYYIIRAEHSLKAFKSNGLCPYSQFVSFDQAASKGILRYKKSEVPAKGLSDTLDGIKKAIKHYLKSKEAKESGALEESNYIKFAQNGKITPLEEMENRMIGLNAKK